MVSLGKRSPSSNQVLRWFMWSYKNIIEVLEHSLEPFILYSHLCSQLEKRVTAAFRTCIVHMTASTIWFYGAFAGRPGPRRGFPEPSPRGRRLADSSGRALCAAWHGNVCHPPPNVSCGRWIGTTASAVEHSKQAVPQSTLHSPHLLCRLPL